jgi:hypothetical protein
MYKKKRNFSLDITACDARMLSNKEVLLLDFDSHSPFALAQYLPASFTTSVETWRILGWEGHKSHG